MNSYNAMSMTYSQGRYDLACPLCNGRVVQAEPCGHCHAPSEVMESIWAREQSPRFVGVLGPSGVGKTVYLGMLLDLLARGAGGLHGLARGPFTLALHRNLILALERQRFPEKTPNEPDRWQWAHCEISTAKRKTVFDLVTPDVAGESVMSEIETPRSNPTIRALISRCEGLVVLADVLQIAADGQGQELFAMQLITYLDTLRSTKKRKVEIPVAVVFTKTDLCDDPIRDPEGFARSNAPGLWRLCSSRLKHYRFFCSGVAGSCGRLIDREGFESLVPLRVEPRGIIEPLAWLAGQLG